MRLYPPVWALVRNPVKECEIGGYRIPAGSTLLMSQWVMHRDPRYYDEPEHFNPDRWVDIRSKEAPKFAYFPFGGGPRTCIGASFAMTEAALVLATIAQRYQVRVAPDCSAEVIPARSPSVPSMAFEPKSFDEQSVRTLPGRSRSTLRVASYAGG